MFKGLWRYFQSEDDQNPEFIRLVRNILIFTILINVAALFITSGILGSNFNLITTVALALTGVLEIFALVLTFQNNTFLGKFLVPPALIIAVTLIAMNAHGIHDISMVTFPVIVIIAFLLQGTNAAFITTPFVMLAITAIGYYDLNGLNPSPMAARTGYDDLAIGNLLVLGSTVITRLLMTRLNTALQQSRANEQAQIIANQELRELQSTLELRVNERTDEVTQRSKELALQTTELEKANAYNARQATQFRAVSEVSRAIASIQKLQDLLPRIVQVISSQFGFYHAGIFLADEASEYAVLAAANSEGGQRMLIRGHRLRIGRVGIVGNVVGTGAPRIALDTGADAVFFQNPDLPDTHSEMALPLRAGNAIIGALDVQSIEPNAFSDDDVEVLTTLADQVSIAIQNARQYEETQKALAEAEAIYRQSLRAEWQRLGEQKQTTGFRYSLLGTQEIDDAPLTEEIQQAIEKGDLQARTGVDASALAVPIKLRGEVIGVLNVRAPGGHTWNANELDIVQAVADRVAISAENARLFEETTSRAERERTVADITNKIRATNDPQEMITTALAELKRALNVSRIQIVPYATPSQEK